MAVAFIRKFPGKQVEPKSLSAMDAALIGFAGFVFTVGNPALLFTVLLQAFGLTVQPYPVLAALGATALLTSIIVPGAAMWLLSVRRSRSHDFCDLLKPPFAAFLLLLFVLLIMLLLRVDLRIILSTPPESIGQYGTRHIESGVSLARNLAFGLAFSFLGVVLAEGASRLRRRRASR